MPTRSSLGLLAAFATLCAAFSAPLTRVCASSAARGAARARTVVAEDEVGDWGVDNLMDLMGEADEKIGSVESFISTVKSSPKSVEFEMTMAAIEDGFDYEPVSFTCGELSSAKDQNQGSAKIFSFGKLQKLTKDQTLNLFGRYYREDVLENPDGTDHGNIRNFIKSGWGGVEFPAGLALTPK
eukprot:CAMPEP_0206166092 /NCGR_PEP_ID=MMETSP1474-20131121/22831_1 /ASSEMBLY_ACC=CAM_ASM_001110 /TAXON_ID=97495 /ORGANISM="Imantonia sp., Strain RCC918" /LENGTH=182 /DNA_ID=CAMNT_0053569885 /DNA_START=25 /DNA_END=573 /DNA_ORIENTATION=+